MHAANENQITILGAAILRFSGKTKEDKTIETRQIVYVTDSTSKIFLSREACVTLGIISQKFPTIGESTCSIGPSVNTLCPCPKREQPPPPPKHPPFPATMENRGRLQQYLLDYYKSSTFNTCEHQPLPMMQGPPMRLMIDTDADPVAVHTPIPVPIRAGNWWKITNSNRTTVLYGGPPQTVVINCNPQIHQTHKITGIHQTERLAGQ